jgi:hypothetical protein
VTFLPQFVAGRSAAAQKLIPRRRLHVVNVPLCSARLSADAIVRLLAVPAARGSSTTCS